MVGREVCALAMRGGRRRRSTVCEGPDSAEKVFEESIALWKSLR
jgi:hypothetical protein